MSTGTDYLARLRNGETLTIPELSVMILRFSFAYACMIFISWM